MSDRREFLGIAAGAGASLALNPQLLLARQQSGGLRQAQAVPSLSRVGSLIQRAIPSTGEMLPVVGLSFSNHPACADHAALKEVLRTMVDNGGRVFDAMHGNGPAEQFHATVANELGVQDKFFWSTRGTPPDGAQPGAATVKAHIETMLARLKVARIDLVMLPPQPDPTWLNALMAEKKAGRDRYVGAQVIAARKRMAAFIDALPPVSMQPGQAPQGPSVLSAAILDRYVGDYKTADGTILTVRRYGTMLVAKPGTNPETVLIARSETRFSLGHRGPGFLEFQPDSTGTVAGLIHEQGSQKVPASRVR